MTATIIAPSILSADFAQLADELRTVESAEWVHVDVMDGHFVPNLTIGPPVVKAVRAVTDRVVDVHLMIEPADPYIDAFCEAGADYLTVHVEACPHLDRTLAAIREGGARAGVALNPATPVSTIENVLDRLDLVLVMSVNPGFGGQTYLAVAEEKLAVLRAMTADYDILLEVDGGINTDTASRVVDAGANVLVAGLAIFGRPDRPSAISALRAAADGAPSSQHQVL